MLTKQDVFTLLRAKIKDASGQKGFARQCGLSAPYVNDVLHGRRALTDSVLKQIGVERQIVYRVRQR